MAQISKWHILAGCFCIGIGCARAACASNFFELVSSTVEALLLLLVAFLWLPAPEQPLQNPIRGAPPLHPVPQRQFAPPPPSRPARRRDDSDDDDSDETTDSRMIKLRETTVSYKALKHAIRAGNCLIVQIGVAPSSHTTDMGVTALIHGAKAMGNLSVLIPLDDQKTPSEWPERYDGVSCLGGTNVLTNGRLHDRTLPRRLSRVPPLATAIHRARLAFGPNRLVVCIHPVMPEEPFGAGHFLCAYEPGDRSPPEDICPALHRAISSAKRPLRITAGGEVDDCTLQNEDTYLAVAR